MAETKIFGLTVNTDALNNIPEMYKIIAGSVVAGLVLLGAGYYVVYPVYEEYQTLFEGNETLMAENISSETKLGYDPNTKRYRRIEDVDAEMIVLNNEIKIAQQRIPTQENSYHHQHAGYLGRLKKTALSIIYLLFRHS
ncbi:hypothetical protein EON78_01260 [bacterium]|nr:MAG: hypothetical protein EON78_01260 [bacterium]